MSDDKLAFHAFAALGSLSERQREAFIDHVILGDTYDQIAVRMGVSRTAIYELNRKARVRLERELTANA